MNFCNQKSKITSYSDEGYSERGKSLDSFECSLIVGKGVEGRNTMHVHNSFFQKPVFRDL